MTKKELRELEAAQIYCAMMLRVPRAGWVANAGHVDEVLKNRKRFRHTVGSLHDAVMAYIEGGCGFIG